MSPSSPQHQGRRMDMEDRETFDLIGRDMVEGTNEYGPDGQKSVTSSVS